MSIFNAYKEMREALRLMLQTRIPFAPQPKGLGLEYVGENLISEEWAKRDAAAEAAGIAALATADAALIQAPSIAGFKATIDEVEGSAVVTFPELHTDQFILVLYWLRMTMGGNRGKYDVTALSDGNEWSASVEYSDATLARAMMAATKQREGGA